MTIHITQVDATDDDVATIIMGLHDACFPGGGDYWDPKAAWWLATTEGYEPVGFGGLRWSRKELGGYLCRGGVVPKARGKGLQRRLIRVREAFAKRHGMRFLVTDTVNNPHSANNLIEAGFRIYEPIAPWGHDEATYWRKDLTGARQQISNDRDAAVSQRDDAPHPVRLHQLAW